MENLQGLLFKLQSLLEFRGTYFFLDETNSSYRKNEMVTSKFLMLICQYESSFCPSFSSSYFSSIPIVRSCLLYTWLQNISSKSVFFPWKIFRDSSSSSNYSLNFRRLIFSSWRLLISPEEWNDVPKFLMLIYQHELFSFFLSFSSSHFSSIPIVCSHLLYTWLQSIPSMSLFFCGKSSGTPL